MADDDPDTNGRLGFWAVGALAAGGMVGGGIYIALGVVIAVAGQWAWLSFALAGAVALTAAFSYVRLSNEFEEGGGAFEFLREIHHEGLAGSLSWVLVIGYVLTMAVYAFAFGHYLSHVFGVGTWVTRSFAVGILAALVLLNLRGVGSTKAVELVIVAGNLVTLVGLGVWGVLAWEPARLTAGIEPGSPWTALIGAAAIFMAYEGFQLLTYEYDEIERPREILRPALLSSVVFVIGVYVLVALGATQLAGALTLIDEKEVALAVAAHDAAGRWGLIALTAAAGCATAAAINSTLFSTAKLARRVADDGELPAWFDHRNGEGIPDRAVISLGALAAVLAVSGSLSTLVEAASLAFLFTFGVVQWIAWKRLEARRWVPAAGLVLTAVIGVVLVVRLILTALVPLLVFLTFVALAIFGRPAILRRLPTVGPGSSGAQEESP